MDWTDMNRHLFDNCWDSDAFLATLNPVALVFTNYGSDPRAYGGSNNEAGGVAGESQNGREYFGPPAATLASVHEDAPVRVSMPKMLESYILSRKFRPV